MKQRTALTILGLIILAFFIYSRWIEPLWIEVTRYRVLADIEKPLKIIHLSDLHTHKFGIREKKILGIIQQEMPDTILISGDTIANEGDWKSVGTFLSRLHAPMGVFLVHGNWEHWKPNSNEHKFYEDSGITFLNNDVRQIAKGVWVVGLDDSLAGAPDGAALAKVPPEAFRIVLFHSPTYFDSIDSRVDLVLAGHTHGGQLRIPFLPPLWLPEGSGNYVAGWYQRGANRMYVSRGVGNSIIEMRFACRPEVTVFHIAQEKNLKSSGH